MEQNITTPQSLKIELGCGPNKREGFIGLDIMPDPAVDIVLNLNVEKLPFEDNSVDYVYTSHAFEHFEKHIFVMRELFRVCKHGATIEIWTPYGKSNDAFLFGHNLFLTEAHFKRICYENDRYWLEDYKGFFDWYKTHYILYNGMIERLENLHVTLDFALEHMFNVALEWGVFLQVRKDLDKAPGLQYPQKSYSYNRDQIISLNQNANKPDITDVGALQFENQLLQHKLASLEEIYTNTVQYVEKLTKAYQESSSYAHRLETILSNPTTLTRHLIGQVTNKLPWKLKK